VQVPRILRTVSLAAVTALAVTMPLTGTASAAPVVGYIKIVFDATTMTEPKVIVSGVLADPTRWDCVRPTTYVPAVPFTVKCTPVPNTLAAWRCDILHANSATTSASGILRTSMFCDASIVPAARTRVVSGAGDYAYQYGPSGAVVQEFRCTIDNGAAAAPVPNYWAFCGDPPSLGLLG